MEKNIVSINFGEGYQKYFDTYYYKPSEHDAKYHDPKAYYDLAEYYRNNNNHQKAHDYYTKSYETYQKRAQTGDVEAYYYLGYFYQYGYGVDKNKAKAEEYYAKAYNELTKYETKPLYLYLLGKLYEGGYSNGKLGNADYQKASDYYGKAASMQYTDAYYRLGYVDAIQKMMGTEKH